MRAIWRGAVSFGLVSVPVRAYTATAPREVRFHQVHAADGGRIHYRKVCEVDGEEVRADAIAKAYDTGDGLVVLSDEDLTALPLASGREIEVVEFVPAEQVDPVLHDKTYYLEPEVTAAKPYALLREALVTTERVAVVTVALRQRESLALLRVRGDVICLQTLLWPAEVREPDVDVLPDAAGSLKPKEVAVAAQLVESLAADFDPSAHSDRYAAAVRELVSEKVERGEVRRPQAPAASGGGGEGGGEVVDLLAALQRSVERAGAKGGGGGPAPRRGSGRSSSRAGARATADAAVQEAVDEAAEAPRAARSRAKAAGPKTAAEPATTTPATKTSATKTAAKPAATKTAATKTAAKPAATKTAATKAGSRMGAAGPSPRGASAADDGPVRGTRARRGA